MSVIPKSLSWLLVGACLSIGTAFFNDAATAQTADIDALGGGPTDDDGADLFGDSSDPFELIHRAVLGPSMSGAEFLEQQNRVLSEEYQNFRLRQQEVLRQSPEVNEGDVDDVSIDDEAL